MQPNMQTPGNLNIRDFDRAEDYLRVLRERDRITRTPVAKRSKHIGRLDPDASSVTGADHPFRDNIVDSSPAINTMAPSHASTIAHKYNPPRTMRTRLYDRHLETALNSTLDDVSPAVRQTRSSARYEQTKELDVAKPKLRRAPTRAQVATPREQTQPHREVTEHENSGLYTASDILHPESSTPAPRSRVLTTRKQVRSTRNTTSTQTRSLWTASDSIPPTSSTLAPEDPPPTPQERNAQMAQAHGWNRRLRSLSCGSDGTLVGTQNNAVGDEEGANEKFMTSDEERDIQRRFVRKVKVSRILERVAVNVSNSPSKLPYLGTSYERYGSHGVRREERPDRR